MTNSWPVTMWYSTLGIGDGHDYATRGYLRALMDAGYEGIRIPPSIQTSFMRFDEHADKDLLRFRDLVRPPKHLRMKEMKRIKAGDPRIGERVIDGIDEHGKPFKETIIIGEGSTDIDEPIETTSYEKLATECVVLHHDPASISRNYTNFTKSGRPAGVAYVGITVWEPDSIPNAVARILSELDCIVVPSEHTRRAFLRSGLETKCVVVPHTFDPEVWSEPALEDFESDREKYVFYSVGTSIARKNLSTLCAAYFAAFEGRTDVTLRLKGSGDFADLAATAKKGLERAGITGSRPPIRLYTDMWPVAKMRAFHLDGDCFVSATRGEGFDLCAFEAKLCASRVITTNWGASPEFIVKAVLVHADELASGSAGGPYRTAEFPADQDQCVSDILVPANLASVDGMYGIGCYNPSQKWAEPDFDALVESMRRAERERISPDISAWGNLRSTYGPEAVGSELADVLRDARSEAKENSDEDTFGSATETTD